ncbi:hypothetical protein MMC12_002105 [Toensbergia leucococca]|nr:hypothetical protein [Toensbergia leucococca]
MALAIKDATTAITKAKGNEPGVIYVGRIPHGFHEHEMRSYFTQFGPILRLRLSRNRRTGASKHYAFIEFASESVAAIVASTMNNYLLFGHILKCRVVPREQVHEKLWIGANRRFKAVPWARIEGRKLERGLGREGWERRVEGERKRRVEMGERLKGIGYVFEGGGLKGVEAVPVRTTKEIVVSGKAEVQEGEEHQVALQKTLTDGEVEVKSVELERSVVIDKAEKTAMVVVREEVKTKKVKKSSNDKGKDQRTKEGGVKKAKKVTKIVS